MKREVKALLLFSGGYDSTCLFYDLVCDSNKYLEDANATLIIQPVYCKYGNIHENDEIHSALAVVEEMKSASNVHKNVIVEDLVSLQLPCFNGHITETTEDCSQGVFAKEYVPFRNATMVLTALSAMTNADDNYDFVAMATHASDTELKFPDCGVLFQDAMNSLLSVYKTEAFTYPKLYLPFSGLTKTQISVGYTIPKKIQDLVFSGYTDGKPPKFTAPELEDDAPIDGNMEGEYDPKLNRVVKKSPTIAEQCKEQAPKFYKQTAPCPKLDAREVEKDMKQLADDRKEIIKEMMREQPATSLMVKEHEPLIIRKFTQYGFPIYVGLICGANLDNLDSVVHGFLKDKKERVQGASIQTMRNIVGELSGHITETYGLKIEGVAVVWYVDKMMVSSLYGDFMTHTSCRIEFFTLLAMMCHV